MGEPGWAALADRFIEVGRPREDGDAGPADVPAGEPFRPWRLRAIDRGEFDALGAGDELSGAQLAYLAWWNVLAPTSHNTMPQRFELIPGGLRIWVDRRFVLPDSDASGRQAAVSLGCGIENTLVAARHYGWPGSVEIDAGQATAARLRPFVAGEPPHVAVADLRFARASSAAPDGETQGLLAAMLARKMVRAEFDEAVKLPPGLGEELQAAAAEHAGLRLHLLDDVTSLLVLGKFQEMADTTVFNRDGFALELGSWLLPNDSSSAVGMRGREFGLDDETALRVHRGLRRELRLLPDEIGGIARASNLGIRSSSAVGVITTDEDTLARRIAAGRAFERLALILQGRGFCTSMQAAITEVTAANLALRGRLRVTHRPTVVFRTGKPLHPSDAARPHASRPHLADLVMPAATPPPA